jgi:polar amino acid transport system permease protein
MSNWFDFALARDILPVLLRASVVSLLVTVSSFLMALMLGIPLMLLRRARWGVVWRTTAFLVEFIRSTPLLVQIFFFYYVLPGVGIRLDSITTGLLALSLHYGCYLSEVYRAGLEAIPTGQWDAATALNYSRRDTFRFIMLPQMVPRIIPAAGNFLIYMLKDSPLLASIGVAEMMFVAKDISQDRFQYLEPVTMCGLIFLLLSALFSLAVQGVEATAGRRWVRQERYRASG